MTVAAVILCPSAERAIADAAGRPAVRRMVESAWAGGAVPIVVVAPDTDGGVAAALAGSPAVLAEPAPLPSPAAQVLRGFAIALERVTDTEAALLWPGRMVWVGPETVTSLVEAHGPDRHSVLRPSYAGRPGWPALVPLEHLPALRALRSDHGPQELLAALAATGVAVRQLELGDPGTILDRDTPLEALPSYEGPTEPTGGPPPEWGSPAGERADDIPLEGPALAPYTQAEAPGD